MDNKIEFDLPLGYTKGDKCYRHGTMRLATTKDELELHDDLDSNANPHLRDIKLLARVIENFEEITPVTEDMIKDLFEADFIYLQLLYNQLNSLKEEAETKVKCPSCGAYTDIKFKNLYKDMSIYENKKEQNGNIS